MMLSGKLDYRFNRKDQEEYSFYGEGLIRESCFEGMEFFTLFFENEGDQDFYKEINRLIFDSDLFLLRGVFEGPFDDNEEYHLEKRLKPKNSFARSRNFNSLSN